MSTAAATAKNTQASRPTGPETREIDRKRLMDGSVNWSPSGELPREVKQEEGILPLKAVHLINYGQQRVAAPGSLFIPANSNERAELLLGEFPAAEEPSKAELALFSSDDSDFG